MHMLSIYNNNNAIKKAKKWIFCDADSVLAINIQITLHTTISVRLGGVGP